MRQSSERDTEGQLQVWTVLAAAISAVNFACFPFRSHAINTDIRLFLYYAAETAHGAVPHVDLFDNKTSLATFAGAFLYRAGESAGIEPLYAVRIGYLGCAALAGVLVFAIHRILGAGSVARGFVALGCTFGFSLLGLMPSIGNVPKMLMAVFASGAGLCAHRRWWLAAGAAGALAFLDWQVGALAVLAALFAASLEPPRRRSRALARVAIGAALALAPFVVWYLSKGALATVWREIIEISFSRGAGSLERAGPLADWPRRLQVVEQGTPGEHWLVAAGIVGMPIYLLWLKRFWREERGRLALFLGVYHYGVVAFSLIDFQLYGDLFILLHSVAFFAAVALNELVEVAARWRRIAPAVVRVVALLLALLAARPWVIRGDLRLAAGNVDATVTLDDQRDLATRLRSALAGHRTLFLGPAEQLFLTGIKNPLPIVFWNWAAYVYLRQSPEEDRSSALGRLIASVSPEIIVCDRGAPLGSQLPPSFEFLATESVAHGYGVDLYRAKADPASR